jgi:PEP-CTERM motif
MTSKSLKFFVVFALSLIVAFKGTETFAATYIFKQSGFPDGGMVTGSFVGNDIHGVMPNGQDGPDGKILRCYGRQCLNEYDEVTRYSIQFSGNDDFNRLNKVEAGGQYLEYNLKTNALTLYHGSSDIFVTFPSMYYRADVRESISPKGRIMFFDVVNSEDVYFEVTTNQPLTASQVPLPSALGLFVMGLAGLLYLSRRRTIN